jgi:hypothetical protein
MDSYGLVLSDELQKVYLDFKEGKDFDRNIVQRLLHYFKGNIITNTAQMKRINKILPPAVEQQLRGAGYTNQPLEDLAKKTVYRIILSTNNNTFPYVNINEDVIENNLMGCFMRGVRRDKAISHIQALCEKAKQVCIYDKYLVRRGDERMNEKNLNSVAALLPHKNLFIAYADSHLFESDVSFLKNKCPKWTFEKRNNIPDHHDRYLIIDDKIEIILTSGFSYLSETSKEFTYIVRPILDNRFN